MVDVKEVERLVKQMETGTREERLAAAIRILEIVPKPEQVKVKGPSDDQN